MKFKNVTKKIKMFKVEDKWLNIQPNDIVELPVEADLNENGLEKLLEEPEQEKKEERLKEKPKKEKALERHKLEMAPEDAKTTMCEKDLKKMTKDELNDFAAVNGLNSVSTRMKKASMINKILKFLGIK